MMSKTVVALALLEQVNAFSAPVVRARQVQMFSEGDIGVLPPLGVYDPLGLIETRNMARYEIMEIKHGRAAMLGIVIGIITEGLTGAGIAHQIGLGPLVDGYAACRTQFLPFCF